MCSVADIAVLSVGRKGFCLNCFPLSPLSSLPLPSFFLPLPPRLHFTPLFLSLVSYVPLYYFFFSHSSPFVLSFPLAPLHPPIHTRFVLTPLSVVMSSLSHPLPYSFLYMPSIPFHFPSTRALLVFCFLFFSYASVVCSGLLHFFNLPLSSVAFPGLRFSFSSLFQFP